MSLENWVRNNWLEQRASDAAEIVRLLALADGRLQDYHRAAAGKLSADVQLFLAYDGFESLPLLRCAPQDTGWYAGAVNITELLRLSSFRSIQGRS